ncbi:unnamed protein product [Rotaria socialis]|uniref:G-protein coupled receptors family 1 profile domain-containing protein n=1 Tax=Rotaria socialis TaxID=392032 RepID=A0A820W8S5_9BILA|nr:unnamed protein product [Rotaria socialis]CAF4514120.1 unnamed protein product [Rotaria socialis]
MAVVAIPIIRQFWMYLISNDVSILCSIFVLYHFLFDRQLRRILQNPVIVTILIVNFLALIIEIPWILYYYLNGVVWIFTPFFCRTWVFIDGFTYVTTARLVAWASIESMRCLVRL